MKLTREIHADLVDNPYRVGKPLRGKYEVQRSARCGTGRRIRYRIDDDDAVVTVLDISYRADTYGTDQPTAVPLPRGADGQISAKRPRAPSM